MTSILFLAANPANSDRLALDWEHRMIEESLEGSPRPITLQAAWAVDLDRLETKLLSTQPTVIHFGGHGEQGGILFESSNECSDSLVAADVLTGMIDELADSVQLVVLNACHTDALAKRLITAVPCAVVMRAAVLDEATATFSKHFYRVLCHGRPVGTAYRAALHALRHMHFDAEAPHLVVADGIDADAVFPLFGGESGSSSRIALNMAPPQPANSGPQEHEFRRALGALDASVSAHEQNVCTAIVGPGTCGKTSLARDLAHDPRVGASFSGGVFWVDMGPTGDPLDGLSAIYAALTGERRSFCCVNDARVAVESIIGEQPCLLIVDGVWNESQLAPFLNWGSRVTRLVTTRDYRVLPNGPVQVVEMSKKRQDTGIC